LTHRDEQQSHARELVFLATTLRTTAFDATGTRFAGAFVAVDVLEAGFLEAVFLPTAFFAPVEVTASARAPFLAAVGPPAPDGPDATLPDKRLTAGGALALTSVLLGPSNFIFTDFSPHNSSRW
jgi:hypothetical protein